MLAPSWTRGSRVPGPHSLWLVILRGEPAIEAGEWDEAETILGSIGGRQIGNALVNLDLRRAELALGRGDHAVARDQLIEAAQAGAAMDEPQFTGVLGGLLAVSRSSQRTGTSPAPRLRAATTGRSRSRGC
jgi:hypothetical protein